MAIGRKAEEAQGADKGSAALAERRAADWTRVSQTWGAQAHEFGKLRVRMQLKSPKFLLLSLLPEFD